MVDEKLIKIQIFTGINVTIFHTSISHTGLFTSPITKVQERNIAIFNVFWGTISIHFQTGSQFKLSFIPQVCLP